MILLKPVFLIAIVAVAMIGVMVPSVFAENDKIPDWVRNIFLWYGQEQISETELLGAITYLIDDKIIDVPKIKSLEGENNFLKQKIQELESSLISNQEYQTKLQDTLMETKQQIVSISENSSKAQIETLARTNPYLNGIITGTINIYVEPVPSYASAGVSEWVDSQSKLLDGTEINYMTLRIVSNENDAEVEINWVKDFGSETLGHAVFKSFVEIGLGQDNCQGDWQAFDTSTVSKIFWHELGHSIGFNHSTKSDNIMYPTIPTQFVTEVDTTFVLDEGYYKTIAFCKSGNMNYNLSSDDEHNGFYAYVLPSTTDPTQFLNNVGEYYPSCSSNEDPKMSFGSTCNVVIGDKLMVYNKDDYLQTSAIQINLKIVDMNTMSDVDFDWDSDAFQYDSEWIAQIYDLFH